MVERWSTACMVWIASLWVLFVFSPHGCFSDSSCLYLYSINTISTVNSRLFLRGLKFLSSPPSGSVYSNLFSQLKTIKLTVIVFKHVAGLLIYFELSFRSFDFIWQSLIRSWNWIFQIFGDVFFSISAIRLKVCVVLSQIQLVLVLWPNVPLLLLRLYRFLICCPSIQFRFIISWISDQILVVYSRCFLTDEINISATAFSYWKFKYLFVEKRLSF